MVKVEHFDVSFENADACFYAGDDLCGVVTLVLKEEKRVNEILLELKGKAKTYWTKHSGKSRQHYTDSEPYFCEQFNTEYTHAFGKPHARVLPAGRHEIPFTYRLPAHLPSSFEGEFGHVRFTCTAILERPWDFDIVCARHFTVVGIEDLNDNKDARESVSVANSDFDLLTCWRKVGSICVNLRLAKAGYVSGETVLVNAEVRNQSNRALKYSSAKIKQHVIYRAKSFMGTEGNKEVSFDLVKEDRGAILPHKIERWKDVKLTVPPVPPKLVKCKVIDINYSLEFEVDPGFVVVAPLYIGNVPLVDYYHPACEPQHAGGHARGGEPPLGSSEVRIEIEPASNPSSRRSSRSKTNWLARKYPNLAPPSFEESHFGRTSVRDTQSDEGLLGDWVFAPKYPCYRDLKVDKHGVVLLT